MKQPFRYTTNLVSLKLCTFVEFSYILWQRSSSHESKRTTFKPLGRNYSGSLLSRPGRVIILKQYPGLLDIVVNLFIVSEFLQLYFL